MAQTTPGGGGRRVFRGRRGTGDHVSHTDDQFRRPGAMHNYRSLPRNKQPRVDRFGNPYVPGSSRRRV